MNEDNSAPKARGFPVSLHEESRFEDPDAFYATLVKALDAAGDDGALPFLCRLVVVLANAVGSQKTLLAALELAERKPGLVGGVRVQF